MNTLTDSRLLSTDSEEKRSAEDAQYKELSLSDEDDATASKTAAQN